MTLVAFDFETLSQSELSTLLGAEYDRETEIRGLLEQGLGEELDAATSLRQRVALLEGMPEDQVETAFERCQLRDGAAELIADLRRSDVTVALITDSFEWGVETALDGAGIAVDHLVANQLGVDHGALTGDVDGPLLDGETDQPLREVAVIDGVDLDRTIAVGGRTTELPMLRTAETAIGFGPEPVVEQYCDTVVSSIRKLRLYFEQHGIIDTGETGS